MNPIAVANDAFRKTLIRPAVAGQTVMTAGVAALSADQITAVWRAVAQFDKFTPANDPHGEHDCALFDLELFPGLGSERLMFKFDYYEDASCTYGAEAPAVSCYRVLTIMFAREY